MGLTGRSTDSRLHHKPEVSRATFSAEGAHRRGLVSHGDRSVGSPGVGRSCRRGRPPPRISRDRVALGAAHSEGAGRAHLSCVLGSRPRSAAHGFIHRVPRVLLLFRHLRQRSVCVFPALVDLRLRFPRVVVPFLPIVRARVIRDNGIGADYALQHGESHRATLEWGQNRESGRSPLRGRWQTLDGPRLVPRSGFPTIRS